jgi:hypothetical protein
MATDAPGPSRRQLLVWLATLVGAATPAARAEDDEPLYLSARNDGAGRHYASGFDQMGAARFDLTIAGRGHAFAVHPRRPEAVLFSRRPGQVALVIDLAHGRIRATIEHARDRLFAGHGVYTGDGALLFATEETGEDGRGVVGCYDPARDYRRAGEFPTHGIGPHEMTTLQDGRTLVVANGGYVTSPDGPGVKIDRDRMRPSLVLLAARGGRLLAEGRLPEPLWRLSLRHLAIGRNDVIAVAAQDEGDVSDRLPLAAVWRGQGGLTLLDAGPGITGRMRGYCGDAAVDPSGALFGVSCPRGGLAVFWDLATARVIGTVDLPDGCGLAPGEAPGTFLLSSGRGGVVRVDPSADRVAPLPASFVTEGRWDNHLAVGRPAGAPG